MGRDGLEISPDPSRIGNGVKNPMNNMTTPPTEPTANLNLAWADHFVGELAACGLTAVCIAPGSRSTPLTLAFARHPSIQHYLHLDERSAAFFALGLAQATERPVALLCTSGTAAAEFHPAVIEAYQSQIPLLVLTADRPHELRYSGANQTVDQVKMYGDHVLWAFDMALPEAEPPAVVKRSLASMAARAYHIANGVIKGPVHLNIPFRKPLEPTSPPLPTPIAKEQPAVQMERGTIAPSPTQLDTITGIVQAHERGLIICGPNCPGDGFPNAVAALAQTTGYPILADPLSGVRFGEAVNSGMVLGGYESYLRDGQVAGEAADVVIRFGVVPTAKWLNSYLEAQPPTHLIHIRENGIWADDLHLVTYFLQANPALACTALTQSLSNRGMTTWAAAWQSIETRSQQIVRDYCQTHFFDGAVVAAVVAALPPGTRLMIGNSLPVRHLDQFGLPNRTALQIFGNRGASGIDGVTSTALGIAAAASAPLVLITGDIAFYHDMNGLLALRQHDLGNVTIVLLNNDGGSIFRRLPVAKFEPPFTELFLTPHGLDFHHVADLYRIAYSQVGDMATFRNTLMQSLHSVEPTIIEVQTDGASDLFHQRETSQHH